MISSLQWIQITLASISSTLDKRQVNKSNMRFLLPFWTETEVPVHEVNEDRRTLNFPGAWGSGKFIHGSALL